MTLGQLSRFEINRHIIQLSAARLAEPKVKWVQGWPGTGQALGREVVFTHPPEGQPDFPWAMAGPKSYVDSYEVVFDFLSRTRGRTADEVCERVQRYMNALINTIRTDFNRHPGNPLDATLNVRLGSVRGPVAGPDPFGEKGWAGVGQIPATVEYTVQ